MYGIFVATLAGCAVALPSHIESREVLEDRASACPAAGAPFHIKALGGEVVDGRYLRSNNNIRTYPRFVNADASHATAFMLTSGGKVIRKNTSGSGPGYYNALVDDPGDSGGPVQWQIDRKNPGQFFDFVLCNTVASSSGCELHCSVRTKNGGTLNVEYVCDIGGLGPFGPPDDSYGPAAGDSAHPDTNDCRAFQMLAVPV